LVGTARRVGWLHKDVWETLRFTQGDTIGEGGAEGVKLQNEPKLDQAGVEKCGERSQKRTQSSKRLGKPFDHAQAGGPRKGIKCDREYDVVAFPHDREFTKRSQLFKVLVLVDVIGR